MENERNIDPEIEKAWAEEAQRRLKEFENGEVEPIPGEQVMKELREKYERDGDN